MATFRQMQDRVLDATGRPVGAARQEIAALINDVYLECVEQSRLNTKSVTKTLTSGKGDYSMANDLGLTDVVAIRSITMALAGDSQVVPLEPTTFDQILRYRMSATVTGAWGQLFALLGGDQLSFWPTPAGADTCVIYYQFRPFGMTQDLDTPDALPPEFHYVVEDGAISRAARGLGPESAGAQKMAQDYSSRYYTGILALRKWRNQRLAAAPRRVAVGRMRRPPFHRNDTYFSGGG